MSEELNGLQVTSLNLENGTKQYDNIKAVRIHSEKYRLLIMKDHAPILGQIKGSIYLLTDDNEIVFNDVHGFFTNIKNNFKFIENDRT